MSRQYTIFPAFLGLVTLNLTLLFGLIGCGNEGPVAPPDWQFTNPTGPITPITDGNSSGPQPVTWDDDRSSDPINPAGGIPTEAIYDVATAMFFLRQTGGGVLSVPLDPDEFAVHTWDAASGENLVTDLVVVCLGGPTSLVSVNGWGLFENASFPLSLTVYAPGYALMSYVETSANVISFALRPDTDPEPAFIFGLAQNLGCDEIQVYTDTLIPDVYIEGPSPIDPEYTEFEISVSPWRTHGFSAFLRGPLQSGEPVPNGAFPAEIAFMFARHFAWDIGPLVSGDRLFCAVVFMPEEGLAGLAHGSVSIPSEYWNEYLFDNGIYTVTPTAIFLDDDRYLAVGPRDVPVGEDPAALTFCCPYFDPLPGSDRTVMAGRLALPDCGTDIVHRDWEPGFDPDGLVFSGFPDLGVLASGISLPVFAWTDPLGENGDLMRIEAAAVDEGPRWFLTWSAGGFMFDTAELDVPLTWISEVFGESEIMYRMQCIDAPGQGIDDFSEDGIIMSREETCVGVWTAPTI